MDRIHIRQRAYLLGTLSVAVTVDNAMSKNFEHVTLLHPAVIRTDNLIRVSPSSITCAFIHCRMHRRWVSACLEAATGHV